MHDLHEIFRNRNKNYTIFFLTSVTRCCIHIINEAEASKHRETVIRASAILSNRTILGGSRNRLRLKRGTVSVRAVSPDFL